MEGCVGYYFRMMEIVFYYLFYVVVVCLVF